MDYGNGTGVKALLVIRKMQKGDIEKLFNIALLAFKRDSEKYGMYPPLLRIKQKRI